MIRLTEIPKFLESTAKAAYAVGMTVEVFQVREDAAIYANGHYFNPLENEGHLHSLMHRVGERGCVNKEGKYVSVSLNVNYAYGYITASIGDVACVNIDRKIHRHRAVNIAVVQALGDWYDRQIA